MTAQSDESGVTPPFEEVSLVGHQSTEQTLLRSWRSGRMHHAILLAGPRGIGKATLAFRLARFLLAHADERLSDGEAASDLSVPADHPVARQVARLAHPDLAVLAPRLFDEENKSGEIKVSHVRAALKTLHTTAGAGGWRVCLVDAADDLNRNAANALLKALEEPPPRTLFALVSHRPGRLLPTLRSRCLRLDMPALSNDECMSVLTGSGTVDGEDIEALLALAGGSPGEAMRIAELGGPEIHRRLVALTSGLPGLDLMAVHQLADDLASVRDNGRFGLFMEMLIDWLAARASLGARDGAAKGALEPWVRLWEKTCRDYAAVKVLNLDRKQLILNSFFRLEETARLIR